MSLKQKVTKLFACYGAPAKFAAETILGAVLPGSPGVVKLVLKAIDCARETSKDVIEYDQSQEPIATPADLERVEQILDLLAGDLHSIMAQVAGLSDVPESARRLLDITLRTDERSRKALDRLVDLAERFDRLEEQNRQLLTGQGYAAGMLEDMLPLVRRLAGMMDFVEGLVALHASPNAFQTSINHYRRGASAFSQGHIAEADATLRTLCDEQPQSSAAFVAVAATHAAGMDPVAAQHSLEVAVGLRPSDAKLAELSSQVTRVATQVCRPTPTADAPTGPMPRIGDTLDGWHLDALLGHGGMGQVFRASRNGQTAALKILNANLSHNPTFIERFKREIKALIRLGRHSNLVEIDTFGHASNGDCWYFVMEWIDGVSLRHHLDHNGPLSPYEARRLFLAVADGLAVAHAQGIVHRDVKPDNILVRADRTPVLVDFGLAAIRGSVELTQPGHSPGYTADFAAPEQIRKGQADARSDVFSLAASLNYGLTYGDRRRREPHLFDAELVPAEFQTLLTKAMHHDPEKRHRDAADFRDSLDAVRVQRFEKRERIEETPANLAKFQEAIPVQSQVLINRQTRPRDDDIDPVPKDPLASKDRVLVSQLFAFGRGQSPSKFIAIVSISNATLVAAISSFSIIISPSLLTWIPIVISLFMVILNGFVLGVTQLAFRRPGGLERQAKKQKTSKFAGLA